MSKLLVSLAVASVAFAAPVQAVTFFSVGAPDPGLAWYETSLVDFDAPMHAGVIETDTGAAGLYTLSSSSAAAPAGDITQYKALGTGGSAEFDFRDYFASRSSTVRSISVYVGSVDTFNSIDVLDQHLNILTTIHGTDLPGSSGDQGAAITNRRLFINFTPSENVGGLRFNSGGVAFEFDTIGASSAIFHNDGPVDNVVPLVTSVPEPASWALMVAGFGLVGVSSRRRRGVGSVNA